MWGTKKGNKAMRIVVEPYGCFKRWQWKLIGTNNKPICVSVKKYLEKWRAKEGAKHFCRTMNIKLDISEYYGRVIGKQRAILGTAIRKSKELV